MKAHLCRDRRFHDSAVSQPSATLLQDDPHRHTSQIAPTTVCLFHPSVLATCATTNEIHKCAHGFVPCGAPGPRELFEQDKRAALGPLVEGACRQVGARRGPAAAALVPVTAAVGASTF